MILNLSASDKDMIDRLLKRSKTSGRSDDNIDTIKHRIEVKHLIRI